MMDFLEMTDHGEQGEGAFDEHALIPSAFSADLKVERCAVGIAKAHIDQGHGVVQPLGGDGVEGLVGSVQGQESPFYDLSAVVQQPPQANPNRPAPFIATFGPSWLGLRPWRIGKSSSTG